MRKKVLIVDDNEINCMLLEELLEESYDIESSQDSSESFVLAKSMKPDLVLLDVMMPGKDGYQICRMLKADPDTQHAKVILVTAKAMREDIAEGIAAGADEYVSKPFDLDALLELVQGLLTQESC